jgi:transposase
MAGMMGIKGYAITGLVAIVLVAGIAWYRGRIKAAELRGQLAEVIEDREAAEARVAGLEVHLVPIIESLRTDADTLRRKVESTTTDLRVAVRSASRWRNRYDEVRNDQGATISDILEAADSTVSAVTEEAKTCSLAFRDCMSLTANLESQVEAQTDRLTASQDLVREQNREIEAMQAILDQGKASWLPKIGAGVLIGFCTTLEPCIGIGATLGWNF